MTDRPTHSLTGVRCRATSVANRKRTKLQTLKRWKNREKGKSQKGGKIEAQKNRETDKLKIRQKENTSQEVLFCFFQIKDKSTNKLHFKAGSGALEGALCRRSCNEVVTAASTRVNPQNPFTKCIVNNLVVGKYETQFVRNTFTHRCTPKNE